MLPSGGGRNLKVIEVSGGRNSPSSVFLDGMLDIVNDYNDQKECAIIRKCMMLGDALQHVDVVGAPRNPMADKMVARWALFLQRKVTEAFS